jgi:hypothetical protein
VEGIPGSDPWSFEAEHSGNDIALTPVPYYCKMDTICLGPVTSSWRGRGGSPLVETDTLLVSNSDDDILDDVLSGHVQGIE